jgi:allantoin racemase
MRHIRIVVPIVTEGFHDPAELAAVARPGTEISFAQIERGPASIESELDGALAAPDTIRRIAEAERDGADAVVIDCMDDPGLFPAREVVSIPVVGACETTMHLGSQLGHRFSVVTVMEASIPGFENRARLYGVREKLASVRAVEIPVLELESSAERLLGELCAEAIAAVEEDGAHALVFGCTGLLGYAGAVRDALAERGHRGIPVIDPIPTAVAMAEALVDLGLAHSKRTWPAPPAKPIAGYSLGGHDLHPA